MYARHKHIILFSLFFYCTIATAQQRSPIYYTVQPQEGLYRVAVKNNVTMEEIRRWNHLASDNLSLGQRLIVGYKDAFEQVDESPSRNETRETYDSGRKPKYYTVQPQEGLYRVAVNNNVTMAEIRSWNNLSSDQLSVGERLIVGYELAGPEDAKAEDKESVNTQALYEEAIERGNKALQGERYEFAKRYYNEALAINPESYYVKKRLNEIDDIIARQEALVQSEEVVPPPIEVEHEVKQSAERETAATPSVEEKKPVAASKSQELGDTPPANPFNAFWFYVKKGDAELSDENYEAALAHYKEAEKIYPSKAYPKTKIKEIEDVLKQYEMSKEPEEQPGQLTWNEPEDQPDVPAESQSVVEEEISEPEFAPPAARKPEQKVETEEAAEIPYQPIAVNYEALAATRIKPVDAVTYYAVLKSKPSDFGKVVKYLPDESQVTVMDYNGRLRNYYKVFNDGSIGWVARRSIRMTKEVRMLKSQVKAQKKITG